MDHRRKARDQAPGLEPGEEILATLLGTALGVTGPTTSIGGLVRGLVRGAPPAGDADEDASSQDGGGRERELAASFPAGRLLVSLTDRRLLAHPVTMVAGRLAEPAAWPHSDVASVELQTGRLGGLCTIRFSDGSRRTLELPRGNRIDEFARAADHVGIMT